MLADFLVLYNISNLFNNQCLSPRVVQVTGYEYEDIMGVGNVVTVEDIGSGS